MSDQPSQVKNVILIVVFGIVAVMILVVFMRSFLSRGPSSPQSDNNVIIPIEEESETVGTNAIPGLSSNEAYKKGYELSQSRDFDAAAEAFTQASEDAVNLNEKILSEYMLASSLRNSGNTIEAIRNYKKIVANPEYQNNGYRVRANAVNKMVSIYAGSPSPEIFNEIFFGEPQIFNNVVAPVDATPNQIDASLLNLHTFAFGVYPVAESSIKMANALFNNNIDLYLKFFNACRTVSVIEINGCAPDVDTLLTAEEKILFFEIDRAFTQHMSDADADLLRLRDTETKGTIARMGYQRSRVLHKAMYLGLVTLSDVEKAMQQAIVDAEASGNKEPIVTSRIEYAVFLSLLEPDIAEVERIAELLRPIYDPEGEFFYLRDWYVNRLTTAYVALQDDEYSIRHEMEMRGPIAISKVEPGYKEFLVTVAGWDFEGVSVSRIMAPRTE